MKEEAIKTLKNGIQRIGKSKHLYFELALLLKKIPN